jgi:hypothetical protein
MVVLWYIFSVGEMSITVSVRTRLPKSDPSAAGVPHDVEAEEAERLHRLRHVERHRALRVVQVPGHAARLG